jgi:hypothetical protein
MKSMATYFITGFCVISIFSACTVMVSRSLKDNIAFVVGTSLGTIVGIAVGGRLLR